MTVRFKQPKVKSDRPEMLYTEEREAGEKGELASGGEQVAEKTTVLFLPKEK